jgi:hypothetical protein
VSRLDSLGILTTTTTSSGTPAQPNGSSNITKAKNASPRSIVMTEFFLYHLTQSLDAALRYKV